MRTVHFAHWAFVNNASRLMSFPTLITLGQLSRRLHREGTWRTVRSHGQWRRLSGNPLSGADGASHGRQFKAWARHSMAVSRFWFSAYPEYTVDQISVTLASPMACARPR